MSALLPVYERDLVLVSGKGAKLFDKEGRTYLDFAAGIAVNGLGYGDRAVLKAIREQSGQAEEGGGEFRELLVQVRRLQRYGYLLGKP